MMSQKWKQKMFILGDILNYLVLLILAFESGHGSCILETWASRRSWSMSFFYKDN